MIVSKPHGIDEDKPVSPREFVYVQAEIGIGGAAIAKGSLCVWDFNDVTIGNTMGTRVVICPAAPVTGTECSFAGFAVKDMAARTGTRGEAHLIQVYGYINARLDNTTGAQTLPKSYVFPSETTAGCIQGSLAGITASEVAKIVGFTFPGFAAAATGTNDIFVKCM